MLSFLLFFISNVYSQNIITFNPITEIDVNELYRESIDGILFQPQELYLKTKIDNSGFEDSYSRLIVLTTIPVSVNEISYTVELVENDSSCVDVFGHEIKPSENWVTLKLDNNSMVNNIPEIFSDFNSDNGRFKQSEHQLRLSFGSFSELSNIPIEYCSGNIELIVGVDV